MTGRCCLTAFCQSARQPLVSLIKVTARECSGGGVNVLVNFLNATYGMSVGVSKIPLYKCMSAAMPLCCVSHEKTIE